MSRTTGTLWGLGTIILGLTLLYPLGSKAKPGEVEAQLRGFGPQIAQKLGQPVTFAPAVEKISGTAAHLEGYRPQPEPIHAPAGLLPVEQQAWEAMARRQQASATSNELTPFFPKDYSQGSLVHGLGMEIVLKPLGSRAAPAQIENGKLVYHNAYPSTDSLNVVTEGRSEEFLLLRDASAPQTFVYDIAATSGVKDINLSDNTVHFKNAKGQQLQIEAPWLIESGGKKVTNAVHWQLNFPQGQPQPRLTLVVNNAEKLHYPVVIDPTWSTVGSLNFARSSHTATLLLNGKVLVVGASDPNSISAELYDPTTGRWALTGNLNIGRVTQTATLLRNGQVLVAGGSASTGYLNSAELYEPLTGKWTITGSLSMAHASHTATLLPNGQVLIVGGGNGTVSGRPTLTTCSELYNPATGSWTVTGSLTVARFGQTATLLLNGKVLITGGVLGNNASTASTELYDATTGTWTTTGSLNDVRAEHTATLLSNGQVLVVGGRGNADSVGSAELFDTTTGTWTFTGRLNAGRLSHTATLLPNGNVLVAGGSQASTELYNAANGTWTTTASLSTDRAWHTATLLPSGEVLVAAGFSNSSGDLNTSELYNPAVGTWTATGNLQTPRYRHTSTLLPNGRVLIAGGGGNSGSLASAELYNPATGVCSTAGSLVTGREEQATVLLTNGKVLVVGGQGNGFTVLASAELYNPTPGTWTATGSLQTERFAPSATLLPDGRVLVAGGYNYSSGVLTSTEIYDPTPGTWTATSSLHTERYGHTATLLPNGKILVTGGDDNSGNALATSELYDLTTGNWTPTGGLHAARAVHTATLLPNGLVMVTGGDDTSLNPLTSTELYNSTTGTWTTTGSLNTARASHTATLLTSGQVAITGGSDGSSALNSTELYNPATGIWTTTGTLTTARSIHAATLLPNGKLLVTGGGDGTGNPTASAELFDLGLGYSPATQPQITTITSTGSALSLTGTGFTSVLDASGGSTNNSPSNIPVVQIESLANEQTFTLPVDPSVGFTGTTITSTALPLLLPDYVLVTVFVNGTPSTSKIFFYNHTPQSQTITFPPIGSVTSGQTVILAATASSGLPVTYSVISGPATISGSTVTFNAVGTVVLAANAAASGAYTAAPQATQTVTVNIGTQTVNFPAIANMAYTPVGFALNATASSGLPITYSKSGPVAVSNGIATLTGVGTVSIRATQAGNANYSSASVLNTFTVTQASQTITFPAITDKVYPATTSFDLAATASSGLATTYTVTSGPATISGKTVTMTGGGTVVIQAHQAGNANYLPASAVSQSFNVSVNTIATQTINFPAINDQPFSSTPFALNATASSGLPITYTATGPVKISNGIATLTGVGTVHIRATQSGNSSYSAASVLNSFNVTQASQTIAFPVIPTQSYGAAPFDLTATASSGLPVKYTVVSGPATLSGTNNKTVAVTGIGAVVIQASQAGNTNYQAATSTLQSFTVKQGAQTITFPTITDRPFTNTPIPLNATSSSGLPITYSATGPVKISNGLATLTGLGTVRIRATQSGNANYSSATVLNTVNVTQGSQTITFPAISTKGYGTPFDLTATASSGLPVTYAITSGPATISGKTVTFTGLGTVVIQASQPGNTNFQAASSVTQSFTVTKGTQTVTFPTISDRPFTTTPFALNATASTGLPITYSSTGPVKISNGIATLTGTGKVSIRASQSGNANYNAASVLNTFTVTP